MVWTRPAFFPRDSRPLRQTTGPIPISHREGFSRAVSCSLSRVNSWNVSVVPADESPSTRTLFHKVVPSVEDASARTSGIAVSDTQAGVAT